MPTPISYTKQQAAEAVGVNPKTLERAMAAGDLLFVRPTGDRGRILILHTDLMAWLTGERRSA